jgi:RNA polymerase sigma factor (sigma-70 family)
MLTGIVRKDEVEEWLKTILEQCGPRAADMIRRKYPHHGDQFIDDVLADALVKAYQGFSGYRQDKGTLNDWFNAIALNEARSRIRRQLKRKEVPLPDSLAAISDPTDWLDDGDEEAHQVHAGKHKDVWRAMAQLKSENCAILVRSVVADEDSGSIGRALDMKPGTIRVRIFRALRQLRKIILSYQTSDASEGVQ